MVGRDTAFERHALCASSALRISLFSIPIARVTGFLICLHGAEPQHLRAYMRETLASFFSLLAFDWTPKRRC